MSEFDLAQLRAKRLPRLQWNEILTLSGEDAEKAIAEHGSAMTEYFSHFVNPAEGKCIGCGATLVGDMLASFLGRATFRWGLAHGEGACRACGYPARAYHRNVGPIEFVSCVLQYHPDELGAA
jgi:hypothetical protein